MIKKIWRYIAIGVSLFILSYSLYHHGIFATSLIALLIWFGGMYLNVMILKPRKYRSIFTQLPVMKIAHMSIGPVVIQGRFMVDDAKMTAPFNQGKCDGYSYQYYKGHLKKDGTLNYVLDHEKSEYHPIAFQDSTDKISLDSTAIQALHDDWHKIKLGNDLVKIKCLNVDPTEEYMLAGNYQIKDEERKIISLDGLGIRYLAIEEGLRRQYQQKNLYFFQTRKRYGILTACFVLIALTVLNAILPRYYVNHLVLIWCYFVGSILIAYFTTLIYKVKDVENIWVNTIVYALFPNVGVIVLSMVLGVSLLPLIAALLIVLLMTWKFMKQHPNEMQSYWDAIQKRKTK